MVVTPISLNANFNSALPPLPPRYPTANATVNTATTSSGSAGHAMATPSETHNVLSHGTGPETQLSVGEGAKPQTSRESLRDTEQIL